MAKNSNLFSPLKIAGVIIKNRVVMAPMVGNYSEPDGVVSDRLIAYYQARARGGVGLIIVEATCIDAPIGLHGYGQMLISHPRYIKGLNRLAEAIKSAGSRVIIQLLHAGRQTEAIVAGSQIVGPSALPSKSIKEIPRELTTGEVEQIRDKFIASAGYAYEAGFDGVEVHAAHGYLINQFLSPDSNIRQDKYGGNLENRARLLMEVVQGIKDKYPRLLLSVRLNIEDLVPGGLEMTESLEVCRMLELAGIDLIHCSCGTYESGLTSIEPASYPEGWRTYMSAAVKQVVNLPVLTGGIIRDPQMAEDIINKNQADLVFLGRPLLADSDWPYKAENKAYKDIRPCIMCNNRIESNFKRISVSCTVNPITGRERELTPRLYSIRKTRSSVTVVGGGPAGMQAALALSQCGFEVKLYEKEERLGGLLNLAAIPPYKERIANFKDYLIRQLEKSSVEIILGQCYTVELLREELPNHLVIATGSKPIIPVIAGWNEVPNCVELQDVLNGQVDITDSQVVIIGGGSNGCETADYLAKARNHITIIEQEKHLAWTMEKKNRRDLLNRLAGAGVSTLTGAKVIQIGVKTVYITQNGQEEELAADYIIAAVGYEPVNKLYFKVKEEYPNVSLIGDALEVKGIKEALFQGQTLALMLAYRDSLID